MKSTSPTGSGGAATLERGLRMLRYVAGHGPIGLAEVEKRFGCSKPTALRALHALESAGFLQRRLIDDAYVVDTTAAAVFTSSSQVASLAGAAAPVLRQLARKTRWPADVGIRDGRSIVVVDSNRRLVDWPFTRRVAGYRPHTLWSAMGRVYLAFGSDLERAELMLPLQSSHDALVRREITSGRLRATIAEVRSRGFARRDDRHPTLDADASTPLDAIAVPISRDGRLVGCLNCVWTVANSGGDSVASRLFVALKQAAEQIAARMRPAG